MSMVTVRSEEETDLLGRYIYWEFHKMFDKSVESATFNVFVGKL